MNKRELRRRWIRERNKQARFITKYQKRFYTALQRDTADFLESFRQGNAQRFINSFIVSDRITAVLRQVISDAGVKYARSTFDGLRVKQLGRSEEWIQAILEYLGTNFYDKGVFQIVQTSRKVWLDAFNLAVNEGWGYFEMSRYLSNTIAGINRNRADLIARTEVGRAIHAGSYVGASKSDFQKVKIWISAVDARTRRNIERKPQGADHIRLNGQTVDFDAPFIDETTGQELMHPHDPTAPASQVIRCRCTFAVENKRDENGRLIRKIPLSIS